MMLFEMLAKKMYKYYSDMDPKTQKAFRDFIDESITQACVPAEDVEFWRTYFKTTLRCRERRVSIEWCLEYFKKHMTAKEYTMALNEENRKVMSKRVVSRDWRLRLTDNPMDPIECASLDCFSAAHEVWTDSMRASGEASFRRDSEVTPYSHVPLNTRAKDHLAIATILVPGKAVLDARAKQQAAVAAAVIAAPETEPNPAARPDGNSGPQQQQQQHEHGSAPHGDNEAVGSSPKVMVVVSKATRRASRCEFVNRGGGSSVVQAPCKTTPWTFPDPFVKRIHESVVTQRFGVPAAGVKLKTAGNPQQLRLLGNPELMRQRVRYFTLPFIRSGNSREGGIL
jgi:hypothetical protein